MAVLHVLEAWMEEDRAAASLANGVLTQAERTVAISRARRKHAEALASLDVLLPPVAHDDLVARLQVMAPRPNTPVGVTARAWTKPEHRLATARSLLESAVAAHRTTEVQARAARLAAQAEADRAAALVRFRAEAEHAFQVDFLEADAWFQKWDTGGVVSPGLFEAWKAEFVQGWARSVLGDERLDLAQARAVATATQDLRVVARAGSGKTRMLVTRALFLQQHCGVDPGEILLVAFNRDAVKVIQRRIRQRLPSGSRLPHVVTFHAFANALLRPEESLVFDDEDSGTLVQSEKVKDVVDGFLLERPDEVRAAMLGFFREDWERIRSRGVHLDRDAFFASRATITRITLGGEYVKSFGERAIANALFESDVDYQYERNFTRGGFNYRPDFTILKAGRPRLVIEYFGVTGDPEYLRNAEKKREFWNSQPDVHFVEISPHQIASLDPEGLLALLLAALDEAAVPHRPLTADEVWMRARRRAVDTFSKTVRGVVNRARQQDLSPDDLRGRITSLEDPDASVVDFLTMATDIYEAYLQRRRIEGFEDFTGIMWRASQHVRDGHTAWTRAGGKERGDLTALRFIHIDEFQDFSLMFMEFILAIRTQTSAVLCCVGDDWQGINGFAGSDLRFFADFETDFPGSATQQLATNYRSAARIVAAGNVVMAGHGTPARPDRSDAGTVLLAHLSEFAPSPRERDHFPGDVGTPALLRLLKHALHSTPHKVAVLFRRNTVPWFVNTHRGAFDRRLDGYLQHLQGHFPEDQARRIEVSTTHKYKGGEADYVIVADADSRAYPLIHPTAPLFEIFGDTIERLTDAERRLFYVATTRAESTLCYLTTTAEPSPFLAAIAPNTQIVHWQELSPGLAADGTHVEIRIHDAYELRHTLRDRFGFKFDPGSKTWYVLRPAEGFDFDAVRAALRFIGPRRIEVRDAAQQLLHHAGSPLHHPD